MNKIVQNLKVGVSGVRGIVGETLTMQLITAFSATFGSYIGKGRIIVGRDTRPSGVMIENAVTAGLVSVGCQPLLAGIIPTPTLQILVDELNTAGGVAITASHNPLQWNALKFIGRKGIFLNSFEARDLLNNYHQMNKKYVTEEEIRSIKNINDSFDMHKQRILSHINVKAIRKSKFKVAIDCCNGVGAYISKAFLEELGCQVVTLFDKVEGRFEREPEPVPSSLDELGKVVRDNQCILGFAQDPDGDRLAIVDGSGRPIGENYTLVLAIKHYLRREKGPVVVSLATSTAAERVMKEFKCDFYCTKIGEINVTSKMLEVNAVIGGESNGGVIWPKVHPCRDSFGGMALILEMMAIQEKNIEELLQNIPIYYSSSKKVLSSGEQAQKVIHKLHHEFASFNVNIIDGLKIQWDDSWVIIRPSNTEPIIRIIAESTSQQDAERLTAEFAERCETRL